LKTITDHSYTDSDQMCQPWKHFFYDLNRTDHYLLHFVRTDHNLLHFMTTVVDVGF